MIRQEETMNFKKRLSCARHIDLEFQRWPWYSNHCNTQVVRLNAWLPAFEAVKVLRSTFDHDLLQKWNVAISEKQPFPNNKSGKFPLLTESPSMLPLPSITYQCFDGCSRSKASRMCHAGGRWGLHWCLKAKGIGCWHGHGHGPIGLWHFCQKTRLKQQFLQYKNYTRLIWKDECQKVIELVSLSGKTKYWTKLNCEITLLITVPYHLPWTAKYY